MKYDKTKLVSLFLSTLIPLIPYSTHAANVNYNPITSRLKIDNYCKPNFANATLGIKAIIGNQDQEIADTIFANSQGCFSRSIDNVKCEKIRIYATAPARVNGQNYEETCAATTDTPTKSQADLEKVRHEAENKARFYANRIAEAYNATSANYAYNFIIGVQAEENQFTSSPQAKVAANAGYNAGKLKGSPIGENKGYEDGNSVGADNGKRHVTNQYRSRIDSPEDKNWKATVDATIPQYAEGSFLGGLTTDYTAYLRQDSADYISNLSPNLQQAVLDHNLNFHVKLDLFDIWFAFSNFRSQYPEQAAYYNNLSVFENVAEAQSTYKDVFTQVYSQIVDDKILKQIKKFNAQAQADGFNAAKEALVHVTYNKGFNEGYEAAAKAAAQAAFPKAYTKAYQTAFDQRVQYLNNNAEIEGIVTNIVDSDGKKEFVIGQPVTLIINEFTNIGRKGGNFKVTLSESINATTDIEIKGSSRVKNVEFKDIASISPSAKLGQQPVNVCIENYCATQNIELKWENQIKGLTKTGVSEKASNEIALFIRGVLLDEWKEIYKSNPDSSPNSTKASPYDKLGNVYDKKTNQYVSGLVNYAKSTRLGQFEKVVSENLKMPGFKEKILILGEDYLRMKKAMLSTETAARGLIQGFTTATVKVSDTETTDLPYSKMTPTQQEEALSRFEIQQKELFAWVNSDPIRTKQLSHCFSKTKSQLVSCVGFMTESEEHGDNYRQWNLGHNHMNRILKTVKAVSSTPLKK